MSAAVSFGYGSGVRWTHPSVEALMEFAQAGENPETVIRRRCRELVANAKKLGWAGPPFDPEILASLNDIEVEHVLEDIRADARIFPGSGGRLIIQYSSAISRERQRFSICHELTHTRFPDCYEEIRHRERQGKLDWKHQELEKLCNIGAAEILIPYDDFQVYCGNRSPSADLASELRQKFDCSMEAMLYRIVDATDEPCAVVFLSERLKPLEERARHPEFNLGLPKPETKYRIDYARLSKTCSIYFPQHKSAPATSVVQRAAGGLFPTAVERWEIAGLAKAQVQVAELPVIAGKNQRRVAALFTFVTP